MKTRRPTCRHCPDRPQYPNAVMLRRHITTDHPEKRHAIDAGKLINPPRGPRPGGSLKRETDAWPGKP